MTLVVFNRLEGRINPQIAINPAAVVCIIPIDDGTATPKARVFFPTTRGEHWYDLTVSFEEAVFRLNEAASFS